jgi:hypothetical protein
MPYKPSLGQGHNQKKDTHTLDFDVTLAQTVKDYLLKLRNDNLLPNSFKEV